MVLVMCMALVLSFCSPNAKSTMRLISISVKIRASIGMASKAATAPLVSCTNLNCTALLGMFKIVLAEVVLAGESDLCDFGDFPR